MHSRCEEKRERKKESSPKSFIQLGRRKGHHPRKARLTLFIHSVFGECLQGDRSAEVWIEGAQLNGEGRESVYSAFLWELPSRSISRIPFHSEPCIYRER